MEFIDFQTAKKTLPKMLREESYSPARGEKKVLWRDPDTLEVIAEACDDDEDISVRFNLEAGPVLFTGYQAKQLEILGDDDDNPEQDFIRISATPEVTYVPNVKPFKNMRRKTR